MGNHPPEVNMTPGIPSRLSEIINGVDWKKADRLATEDEAEREAATRDRQAAKVESASRRLWLERGSRYEFCRLGNFKLTTEAQRQIIRKLLDFADDLRRGLLLIGPPGTGKDHLMAAMMSLALVARLIVKWTSGLGLFRRLRDAIDTDSNESELLRTYTKPDILAISDPTWERKPLTDWQQQRLGEIVDERWNNCRPIWVTINAAGRADAERMLGHAVVDRLRDGALSLPCDWESYRKSMATTQS